MWSSVEPEQITITSYWARWRLKSSASRLFTQPFIQAQIIENMKDPHHWPLWGEFTDNRNRFPFEEVIMSYSSRPINAYTLDPKKYVHGFSKCQYYFSILSLALSNHQNWSSTSTRNWFCSWYLILWNIVLIQYKPIHKYTIWNIKVQHNSISSGYVYFARGYEVFVNYAISDKICLSFYHILYYCVMSLFLDD